MTFQINGVPYQLKQPCDLSFLRSYGKAFAAFDENDSGNISFGVKTDDGKRYFVKIAGAQTMGMGITPAEAVANLKNAMPVYEALRHPALIELVEHSQHGALYAAVFKWVQGDCLLDHWNFERYAKTGEPSPYQRFRALPLAARLRSFDVVCNFFQYTAAHNYVAINFYDGSVMYDFATGATTICDIDFYQKAPYHGDMGRWGSTRILSPEEYQPDATLDEVTNVFTLGAMSFVFFGGYVKNFHASASREFEHWQAGKARYDIAMKAVSPDRKARYGSIAAFMEAWNAANEPNNEKDLIL